ncbi:MAG: phosphoribosylglycinamide formyltransferase [Alphaproteobacteria bacterium]
MHAIAILISGRGSNMKALIDACAGDDFPAQVALVISNRANAPGLALAQEAGIETRVIDHADYPSREAFDNVVEDALLAANVDTVCLAGFMRILSIQFAARWQGRILNIHPSLLPAFPGLKPWAAAIDAGVRVSGCTVQYVTPELDAGPIIGQAAVPVYHDDTPEDLAARILAEEHKLYPACLRLVAEGKVKFGHGRAVFRNAEPPLWLVPAERDRGQ